MNLIKHTQSTLQFWKREDWEVYHKLHLMLALEKRKHLIDTVKPQVAKLAPSYLLWIVRGKQVRNLLLNVYLGHKYQALTPLRDYQGTLKLNGFFSPHKTKILSYKGTLTWQINKWHNSLQSMRELRSKSLICEWMHHLRTSERLQTPYLIERRKGKW